LRSRAIALFVAIAVSVTGGCAAVSERHASPAHAGREAITVAPIDVPFHTQTADQCGPAALAMTLGWSGLDLAPEDLATEVYSPKRHGSLQPDLVTATRRHGRIAYPLDGRDELVREVHAGHPAVVFLNVGLSWWPRWHYAVVTGYDAAAKAFIINSGKQRGRVVGETTFLDTWGRAGSWALLTLAPDALPAKLDERRWLEAAVGLERAGRPDVAAVAYRTAIARWPASYAARIGLANTAYALGDLATAETALRQAVTFEPSDGAAWNNLAQVLGERGRKREALAAISRAVEIGGPELDTYNATRAEIEAR